MKNQSLIFKVLGVAFVAILAWALYDMSSWIFPSVNSGEHAVLYSIPKDFMHLWETLPYVMLLVFFVFLRKDNPDSKAAKYALWTAVVAVSMLVLSYVLQIAFEAKLEALEQLKQRMHARDEYNWDLLNSKEETIALLYKFSRYLSAAGLLLVIAFIFVFKALKDNKKLAAASFSVIVALLFARFFYIPHFYTQEYLHYQYYENVVILQMIKVTLCFLSFAYLFYAYSQKDEPQVTVCRKLSVGDWITIAGVGLTMIFFFCNWIDYEKNPHHYLTIGCHVVPIAAIGLMFMPIAIASVLGHNNKAKKISAIALIAWPFVVGLATWFFEVNNGQSVGDILNEANNEIDNFSEEFHDVTRIHYVILYAASSFFTGLMLLLTDKVRTSTASHHKLTKDEEIAKLRADIEALKAQINTQDAQDTKDTAE